MDDMEKRKNPALAGKRTLVVQPVVQRYAD
jgi:hypothetical protein